MDSIVNRLTEIEDAASAIVQHAEDQKEELNREYEEKRKAFDADLEARTQARIRSIREELEQNYPDIEIVSAAYQNQDERSVDDIVAAVFYEYPELKAYQAMNEETTEALISAIEMYGPEDRTILTAGFDAPSAEMKDTEDGKLAGVLDPAIVTGDDHGSDESERAE